MNTVIVNLALNLLLNLIAPFEADYAPNDAQVKEQKVEVVESSAEKGKVNNFELIL